MDDLISRQAAIDAICNEWCGVSHKDCIHPFNLETDDYYWCDGCEMVLNTLPNLPSAEPEGASMILGTSKDGVRLWYQCSVCGEPANADDNYCCNCGRKFING